MWSTLNVPDHLNNLFICNDSSLMKSDFLNVLTQDKWITLLLSSGHNMIKFSVSFYNKQRNNSDQKRNADLKIQVDNSWAILTLLFHYMRCQAQIYQLFIYTSFFTNRISGGYGNKITKKMRKFKGPQSEDQYTMIFCSLLCTSIL